MGRECKNRNEDLLVSVPVISKITWKAERPAIWKAVCNLRVIGPEKQQRVLHHRRC